MSILNKIVKFIGYIGVPKKKRLDYYFQKIISDKTGFNVNKIDMLYAEKSNIDVNNEFDSFIFNYMGLTYKLIGNKLSIIEYFII